ncbi:MAG: LysM peptidoglycan-binding domain-containing protein [Ectothiorhodospiraceae bacterium]|nr:LysM peptidoglycan-binding domain-containing protein [Chromatiales bacterium]MCP5155060.1 LysM peptidoglycan-binding domain-containing protein [Ectothiorhodospiraceae bacterium]
MGRLARSALLLAFALTAVAASQAATLSPGHPSRYVVQKGDTLWDISGRFLSEPWRWPEVWEANPQIKNPHLIYPGDEVVLAYRDGKPVLRVRRGRPTVKLSPSVRESVLDAAIPTIPFDAIQQFLARPLVVTEDQLAAAPYVVSVGREALIARPGEKFYARGIDDESQTRFAVYRRGQVYTSPAAPGEVLGLEALHVGDAVLDIAGDPATLVMTGTEREVLNGDRLMPVEDDLYDRHFLPRAPSSDVNGQIIAVVDGVTQIGQHQIVVLDLGTRDGIEVGHVMAVYQRGETVVDELVPPKPPAVKGRTELELDPKRQGGFDGLVEAIDDYGVTLSNKLEKWGRQFNPAPEPHQLVKLPDERAGTLMVFRPFERVSYALVMEATRAMHVEDTVRSP